MLSPEVGGGNSITHAFLLRIKILLLLHECVVTKPWMCEDLSLGLVTSRMLKKCQILFVYILSLTSGLQLQ